MDCGIVCFSEKCDMTDFWQKVHTGPVLRPLTERLKERTNPLVLWGIGDIGLGLYQLLSKEGIEVCAAVVDEPYYCDGMTFCGMKVETFSMVSERFDKFDVLIGHAAAQRASELKKMEKVDGVFYSTGLSYGQTEPFSLAFIREHKKDYEELVGSLADTHSVDCLAAFLSARICDDASYVWPLAPKERITYFDNDVLKVGSEEVYLDIGAYNGDTIEAFTDACEGRYKQIIGIEADDTNFGLLYDRVNAKKLENCCILQTGTWEEETTLFLSVDAEQTSVLNREDAEKATTKSEIKGREIKVVPPDKLMKEIGLFEGITLYKINFYAGVLETLKGSRELLCANRPKIVLTVGFDNMALLTLPKFLRETLGGYTYYLRYMQAMPGRLVLFALPKEE